VKTLGMFARHPVPGATKTRLARGIGDEAAARCSAAFVKDICGRLSSCADQFVVSATPHTEAAAAWFREALPEGAVLEWQTEGCLGARIGHFFESQFRRGAESVVLIGSDSPDLPQSRVGESFRRLTSVPLVLTPADDGGFVTIGMSRRVERSRLTEILESIPWSTPETCAETVHRFAAAGSPADLLQPWFDIDDIDDLKALADRIRRMETLDAAELPETCRTLSELGIRVGDE